jgi:hypothetical protein
MHIKFGALKDYKIVCETLTVLRHTSDIFI